MRPTAVFVFAEHAREVITSELALWMCRALLGDANTTLLAWPQVWMSCKNYQGSIGTCCGMHWHVPCIILMSVHSLRWWQQLRHAVRST